MHHLTHLILILSLLMTVLTPPTVYAEEVSHHPVAVQVANAYGFENWDQVEEIRYTFNVLRGKKHTARTWTWRPNDGLVTLEKQDADPVTYKQSEINEDTPKDLRKIDHHFINDVYWLLYPFQLVWSNPAVTDEGDTPLPIGEGSARKLITQYPDEGGYTPGDAYDLYLDNNNLITHWVFRRGGGDKGNAMTWENNIDLGPIKVCTDHYNADKSFRLWFDGLSLTTTDGKTLAPPTKEAE